ISWKTAVTWGRAPARPNAAAASAERRARSGAKMPSASGRRKAPRKVKKRAALPRCPGQQRASIVSPPVSSTSGSLGASGGSMRLHQRHLAWRTRSMYGRARKRWPSMSAMPASRLPPIGAGWRTKRNSTAGMNRNRSRPAPWAKRRDGGRSERGTRPLSLTRRGEDEPVALRIAEHREVAPGLALGRPLERDAARGELLVGRLDVVATQRAVEEAADAVLVALRREQHEAGVRRADPQLDPALLVVERLVGDHFETELLGVERERGVLVAHGDADEFDAIDHGVSPGL